MRFMLYIKTLASCSRLALTGKRRHPKALVSSLAALLACAALSPPASAQAAQKIVIPRAFRVVFSHTGVHTHANYLLFDTGALDLLKLQQDPVHYPHLAFQAHCSLPTDRAGLPPDLAALGSPGDPPIPNPYGPIDGTPGKSGWTALPGHQNGKNIVRVLAPTRFANWLAQQSPARRRQYAQPRRYTLTIRWG